MTPVAFFNGWGLGEQAARHFDVGRQLAQRGQYRHEDAHHDDEPQPGEQRRVPGAEPGLEPLTGPHRDDREDHRGGDHQQPQPAPVTDGVPDTSTLAGSWPSEGSIHEDAHHDDEPQPGEQRRVPGAEPGLEPLTGPHRDDREDHRGGDHQQPQPAPVTDGVQISDRGRVRRVLDEGHQEQREETARPAARVGGVGCCRCGPPARTSSAVRSRPTSASASGSSPLA